MEKKHLKRLIKKYQQGTANAAEKFVVEYWYESLGNADSRAGSSSVEFIPERKDLKARIISTTLKHSKKRSILQRKVIYLAAASIILLLLSPVFYKHFSKPSIDDLIKPIETVYLDKGAISTGIGERRTVILDDGTKVVLNANSRLSVGDYTLSRNVNLDGEAFFDVKKDPERPFTVHGGGLYIKVLGTSFNVRAYPGIQNTTVSVKTGKVQVDDSRKNLYTLSPDENISYDRKSNDFKLEQATYPLETSWLSDDVRLDRATFEELDQYFKNFYGTSLHTEDAKVLMDHYNITFRTSKSMEASMKEIQILTGKKAIIKKETKEIILY